VTWAKITHWEWYDSVNLIYVVLEFKWVEMNSLIQIETTQGNQNNLSCLWYFERDSRSGKGMKGVKIVDLFEEVETRTRKF